MYDRIVGAKSCLIAALLMFFVALSATLIPHAAAAQTASLVIETVPPIEGIKFRVDGDTLSTDEEGAASVDLALPGRFELSTSERVLLSDSHRVEFATWSDGVIETSRVVDIEGETRLQLGLNVDYLIGESFRTSNGDDLNPRSIDSFAIEDDAGETSTFPGGSLGLAGPTAQIWERFPAGTRWLRAVRISLENDELMAEEVSYEVRSVTVEGERMTPLSTRFVPSQGAEWAIGVDTAKTSSPNPALILVPILVGGFILWFLVRWGVRARRQPSMPSAPASAIGFGRRQKSPTEPVSRELTRVRLRTGRTIEGWRTDVPGADQSEAIILEVTSVWGPDGKRVMSQPTDCFLLPSQIIEIETYEDSSRTMQPRS